mmetsp:Transcript_37503/g.79547  ORF Transcript_37503/g.79547 Transcript_37503/m.79547 type:complete len:192 (+) Transcript_37503:20-595(+)
MHMKAKLKRFGTTTMLGRSKFDVNQLAPATLSEDCAPFMHVHRFSSRIHCRNSAALHLPWTTLPSPHASRDWSRGSECRSDGTFSLYFPGNRAWSIGSTAISQLALAQRRSPPPCYVRIVDREGLPIGPLPGQQASCGGALSSSSLSSSQASMVTREPLAVSVATADGEPRPPIEFERIRSVVMPDLIAAF